MPLPSYVSKSTGYQDALCSEDRWVGLNSDSYFVLQLNWDEVTQGPDGD